MLPNQLAQLVQLFFNQQQNPGNLQTSCGQEVQLIRSGIQYADDQLPVNQNATVKIGGQIRVGNLSFRYLASDLQQDRTANDSTVLCVVAQNNTSICRSNGEQIPTLVFSIPEPKEQLFRTMIRGEYTRACAQTFAGLQPVNQYNQIARLTVERLERKCNEILQHYTQHQNSWNDAFYITLFRSMGASLNQTSYMKLAQTVSYSNICQIKESLLSVEALLLGGAGLLEMEFPDDYIRSLQAEFEHLRRRFSIKPMRPTEWVFTNRPNGHPVLRIVELASLLASEEFLFSRVVACRTPDDIAQVLSAQASAYWSTHSVPGKETAFLPKVIGETMLNTMGINLVVPLMFTYGSQTGNEELKDRALELLEMIPAERNRFVNSWSEGGVQVENAFFSQGLLQQSREYCGKKQCAVCNIGRIILCSQE